MITFVLFISKNIIISGYPLYPIQQFGSIDLDWKVPSNIIEFYKTETYLEGMNNTNITFNNFSEKFKFWLFLPKLDGLFNKMYLILIITFPLIIYKLKNKTPLLIIYLLAILQFIPLWHTSPQYRFFFVFIAFLAIQELSFILKNKNLKVYLVVFASIITAIPVFISINLNSFTSNHFAMTLDTFKLKNIFTPEKNTKTLTDFTKETIDGFEFYSPNEDIYFWITGDGNLPCVNKKQIEYFHKYYKYIPELRSKKLNDGFRSKKLN
ncbi:hypothetical protein R6X41_14410 [Formosa sp. PL04]|nr:hypothetical protein [Formosa sp. PL04]MDW5290012.1 hypothetical protein [Formosa sp. PL04]